MGAESLSFMKYVPNGDVSTYGEVAEIFENVRKHIYKGHEIDSEIWIDIQKKGNFDLLYIIWQKLTDADTFNVGIAVEDYL